MRIFALLTLILTFTLPCAAAQDKAPPAATAAATKAATAEPLMIDLPETLTGPIAAAMDTLTQTDQQAQKAISDAQAYLNAKSTAEARLETVRVRTCAKMGLQNIDDWVFDVRRDEKGQPIAGKDGKVIFILRRKPPGN